MDHDEHLAVARYAVNDVDVQDAHLFAARHCDDHGVSGDCFGVWLNNDYKTGLLSVNILRRAVEC